MSLLHWLWTCHERNPVNVFPITSADACWVISHPATRSVIEVDRHEIEVLLAHGLVRGRSELTLTKLGRELGYGLRRGERLSPEAREALDQVRQGSAG